jgi:hypothetical protein
VEEYKYSKFLREYFEHSDPEDVLKLSPNELLERFEDWLNENNYTG